MKRILYLAVTACLLTLAPMALLAHHGQAAYSTGETVTVKGVVTDFKFVNPHCIISLDVTDPKGVVQKWQGELTSPNHLLRAGWNGQSLKPGDKAELSGWRAKSGAFSLWITKTVVNGEELKTAAGD